MTCEINTVLGLPDGGAVIASKRNNMFYCTRIDHSGAEIETILKSLIEITCLIWQSPDNVLVFRCDGTVFCSNLREKEIQHLFKIDNVGYLSAGLAECYVSTYLIVDHDKGEVLLYNCLCRSQDTKVKNLMFPTSISKAETQRRTLYFVCEALGNKVHIYNRLWNLQRTIGGQGFSDGEFDLPWSLLSLNEYLLVADCYNNRISKFTFEGDFVCHILEQKDGIRQPVQLSYLHPNLWVVCYVSGKKTLKCYELDEA